MRDTVFIGYYRVSTEGQGLGLSAQEKIVREYVSRVYGDLVGEYVERESGGKGIDGRPVLGVALEKCREIGGVLVVATLSRLTRDLHFLTGLERSGVDFVVCDMPGANRFTLNIMGAVAQYERELISERTKRAMGVLRERGVKLGSARPEVRAGLERYWERLRREKRERKKVSKVALRDAGYEKMIRALREEGKNYREVTDFLNMAGVKSVCGKRWHRTSVRRYCARVGL